MNPHVLLKDEKHIKAVENIKRIDEKGYLYYMEYDYDYYELAPLLEKLAFNAGCSTFVAKNPDNEYLMYRNYDFRHRLNNDKNNPYTGLNVVCKVNNPKAKYKSIGVADAFWLDSKKGNLVAGVCEDGTTDLSAFAMLPFLTVDGVNSAGLAVSVMALAVKADWKEIDYATYQEKINPEKANYQLEKAGELPDIWAKKCDIGSIAYNDIDQKAWICEKAIGGSNIEGRKTVMHTVLMRMMLDNCANVDEAIAIANTVNVTATIPGTDMHVLVTDSSGNCKVLEWVDNKMNVVDSYHSTNFRFSADDMFHGECPRDNILKAALQRTEKVGMKQEYGELAMRLASQDPEVFGEGSVTLFSCVYNLPQKTLKVFSFHDFSKAYNFSL